MNPHSIVCLNVKKLLGRSRRHISDKKRKKKKIVFDDMIADLFSNEKLNPIVTELFIGGRKLNNSLVPKKY